MLAAHHLTKSYNLQILFENLTFNISSGDRIGLIGPNGCGKTTLFRILIGKEEPDSGQISRAPISADSRLLERAFKIRFGLKLCLFTLLGGAGLVALLYLALARTLGGSYGEAIYTIYELKIRALPLIFASFYSIVILGLVTVGIAAISMLFSHRIAGPLYRMRKISTIASGDLTVATRFRGQDQLTSLADELNAMVRSLNHATRSAADSLEGLRKAEETLRALLDMDDPPERALKEAIAGVRATIDDVKKSASSIRARQ